MNLRNLTLLAIGIVLFLILAIVVFFPNPKAAVLKRMDALAKTVSMEEFKALDAIKDAQDFLKFFTNPVLIETKYGEFNATHDRESLKNLFLQGRASCNSVKLEFSNRIAEVNENKNITVQTDARMHADLKRADPENLEQTLIFHWKKADGKWKIHKIVPIELPEDL